MLSNIFVTFLEAIFQLDKLYVDDYLRWTFDNDAQVPKNGSCKFDTEGATVMSLMMSLKFVAF